MRRYCVFAVRAGCDRIDFSRKYYPTKHRSWDEQKEVCEVVTGFDVIEKGTVEYQNYKKNREVTGILCMCV